MYAQFPRDRRRSSRPERDRYFGLRNILNSIFMLGALIGIALYFIVGHTIGTIVILVAMVFKFVECIFRFIR